MDGISSSRGWDKEIPHGVLPMEQLVLSDKWARKYSIVYVDDVTEVDVYSQEVVDRGGGGGVWG